jgi:nucleotide-binding universal stress UspA family protein
VDFSSRASGALGIGVAEAVLAFASAWATAFRTPIELVVLYVADPEPAFVSHDADTPEQRDRLAQQLRDEHRATEEAAARLRAEGIATTSHMIRGAAAETILETAAKSHADLLVIGSNGHNRVRSLLLGSVTDALLRRATVPIIIVPG